MKLAIPSILLDIYSEAPVHILVSMITIFQQKLIEMLTNRCFTFCKRINFFRKRVIRYYSKVLYLIIDNTLLRYQMFKKYTCCLCVSKWKFIIHQNLTIHSPPLNIRSNIQLRFVSVVFKNFIANLPIELIFKPRHKLLMLLRILRALITSVLLLSWLLQSKHSSDTMKSLKIRNFILNI